MVDSEQAVIVNALVRQALVSAEEVIGTNGLHTILRRSGLEGFINNLPPNDTNPGIKALEYAHFNEAIESFYGRGGRGILLRIGRASFQYGVREQGALLGVAGAALKLMPQKQRIKFILNALVGALKKTNPQVEAWIEENGEKYAYYESTCAICKGRKSDQPICYLYVGSIGEAVRWATDRDYDIVETDCIAQGDPYCRFEVRELKQ